TTCDGGVLSKCAQLGCGPGIVLAIESKVGYKQTPTMRCGKCKEFKRLCVWLWLLTMVSVASGAGLQTLYSFSAGPAYPFAGLVRGRDGNFYGTTMFGGVHGSLHDGYGTVFRVTTNGVMTTLVSFAGNYGYYPQAGLIEAADGSFYGTTS